MSITVAMPVAADIANRNYNAYSAFLESQGLIRYEGEGAVNRMETLPLAPPRQDVGFNNNEMPSALGREFAQSDFSRGAGQSSFHKRTSDQAGAKFNHSEGFDISEIGVLTHLHSVSESTATFSGATGKTCKAGGFTFVASGTGILRFADITGASTAIDPHNGEAATTVYDLTTEGTRIFAALGVNGVHVSDDNGATWTHAFDLLDARLVSFLKDRLIACDPRILYELTVAGPGIVGTDKTTLKQGWEFTSLGETGQFVYASAVDRTGEQSRVFHYGLDSALAFIQQGSTPLPDGDLAYSVRGSASLGVVLIGGGRVSATGVDTLLYRAFPTSEGFLPLELVMDSEGATSDLACRSIISIGRRFLLSWSLGTGAPFGAREGIAVYDPVLDSFAHHLKSSDTPAPVLSIEKVAGRIVFTTANGLYYENLSTFVTEATFISSTADFNNPGPKNWDRTQLNYKSLPNGSSIDFQYSLRKPEEGIWSTVGSATVPGSTEESFRHANIESPRWTVKLVSNSTGAQAPEIEGFATRANQTVSESEFRITRTFVLADRLTLNKREVRMNPREVRDFIEGKYRQIFDYYEADYPAGFYVRLSDYAIIEPGDTSYQTSTGDQPEDAYLLMCTFEGTRNAA